MNLARLSADGGVVVAFPSPTPAAPNAGHTLEYWTTALGEWDTVRLLEELPRDLKSRGWRLSLRESSVQQGPTLT